MWPVERFAAPGQPTGVGNMWRCFPWLKPSRRPSLLLVHLVPSVRIIAGVGRIGSHATVGGDLHRRASRSLAYLRFSPSTNQGGIGKHRSFSKTCHLPSELIMRAK